MKKLLMAIALIVLGFGIATAVQENQDGRWLVKRVERTDGPRSVSYDCEGQIEAFGVGLSIFTSTDTFSEFPQLTGLEIEKALDLCKETR